MNNEGKIKDFGDWELQDFKRNISLEVVLVIFTCGIYDIFWQYRQMKFVNLMLNEEKFSVWRWFFLTLLTCGLYNLYHEYVMARELVGIQEAFNLSTTPDLPSTSLILSLISFGIIADALQQSEINKMIDRLETK